MSLCKQFFERFPREFNFYFYGVDIIVDERTGVHYFVDCNYLSNYANIPENELIEATDTLIRRLQAPKTKGEEEEKKADEEVEASKV